MNYSRFAKKEEIIKHLPSVKVDEKKGLLKSGIPVGVDGKDIMISNNGSHSMIIGSTGSDKTQSMLLPMMKFSRLANESILINDMMGEIYEQTHLIFEEDGYEIIKLDFKNFNSNNKWNPFALAEKLYNDNLIDKTVAALEKLGYYVLNNFDEKVDNFWINSSINYFVGCCLYLLENKKELSFMAVNDLSNEITNNNNFINELQRNLKSYQKLFSILKSPNDTRGGIITTFEQAFQNFTYKKDLCNYLNDNNIDFDNILNNKVAIYIIPDMNNESSRLSSLFIDQLYFYRYNLKECKGKFNILLDDFYNLYTIEDFPKILSYSRVLDINFTIFIRGFNELYLKYKKNDAEIIKMECANLVYLLSSDLKTLEEISELCGKEKDGYLISVEELKMLDRFEAIIIAPRLYPIKTNLLPYYKMNDKESV